MVNIRQVYWVTAIVTSHSYIIPTFRTWPKSHPIRPDALTRAGFLYTGEGDKVTCPWCKISLIEWETYDIPMDEHKRHAPTSEFVKMIMPKNSFFSPTS